MAVIFDTITSILSTTLNVLPIVIFIFGFQLFVLRKPLPHIRRLLAGLGFVVVGLGLFLIGLETALFPLGHMMAQRLTSTEALIGDSLHNWTAYMWVYAFALSIGFATTIAEPALRAVAMKAHEVSGGASRVERIERLESVPCPVAPAHRPPPFGAPGRRATRPWWTSSRTTRRRCCWPRWRTWWRGASRC